MTRTRIRVCSICWSHEGRGRSSVSGQRTKRQVVWERGSEIMPAASVRLSLCCFPSSPLREVTNVKAFSLPLSSSPPFNETSFVPSASEFVTLLALECIVVYHKLRNLPHSTRNSQIAPSSVRLRSVTLLKSARCGSGRPFQSPKLASHSVF